MFGFDSIKLIIVGAIVAALIAAQLAWGSHKFDQGVAKDKVRSDKVISGMVTEHEKNLAAANAKVESQNEINRMALQGATRGQELERKRTSNQLAAVAADRGRMRDALAAAASGGVEATGDTVAACRERASAFGRVLDETLQAGAQCAGDAEDLASGVRTLLTGWPRSASGVVTE